MLSSASRSLSHDSSIRRLKYQLRASFSVPELSQVSLDLAPSWAFYGYLLVNNGFSWLFVVIRGHSWSFVVIHGHSRSFAVIHGHSRSFAVIHGHSFHVESWPTNIEMAITGLLFFQPIRNQHFINSRDHFLSRFSSGADLCPFYVSDISICYPFYIFLY